ncbi:MAG TPA: hypothetical protein VJS65_13920, partial [Verrucomicrobiae bacterium]|nr:hypothetical protein [Verrucomicrobiae bacterium]
IGRSQRGLRNQDSIDLEEVIDVTQFPQRELQLWQTHLRLLDRHVTQPYDGRLHLFRTRGHPIFCSLARDFEWGKLVAGDVIVTFVPGSHESVFMEPNVRELAGKLENALATADLPFQSEGSTDVSAVRSLRVSNSCMGAGSLFASDMFQFFGQFLANNSVLIG